MHDWAEAARNPVRALTTAFLLGWLGAAPYVYYRMTDHNVVLAALFGTMIGLVLTVSSVAQIARLRGWPQFVAGELRPVFRIWLSMSTIFIGAGLATATAGAAREDLELSLIGLPLVALGVLWHLIKRSTLR